MSVFHADGQATFYQGDVIERLREMPENSVHTCVTSPPYWGLRDYGTATWEGGDAECAHESRRRNHRSDEKQASSAGTSRDPIRATECRCGARRVDQQLGLEATPEEFIEKMVAVFREVRRVLREDGTLWLNIGDSYNAGTTAQRPPHPTAAVGNWAKSDTVGRRVNAPDLKPKDLVGIPWLLAFALRADGWYLRQDIIWAKPNPMPESVTDRCTKAHEYLFLLTKSARYYYDQEAIREGVTGGAHARGDGQNPKRQEAPNGVRANSTFSAPDLVSARNKRTVWTIATEAYPEAHFATFPTALVKPCILAGTSERGVCSQCGAPWLREVERTAMVLNRSERTHEKGRTRSSGTMVEPLSATTIGWAPSCKHEAPAIPATVLDPFLGSGTTAYVAKSLGRHAVGIDLNPEYLELARRRCAQMGLEMAL